MMQTRTIHTTDKFIIRQRAHKSTGRKYYELALNINSLQYQPFDVDRVRNIIDPTRNRSGHWGTSWKYSNRRDAEQALTLLLMTL